MYKLLMLETSDQLLPYNSELVIIFLKFLYDQDLVKLLLETSEANYVEIDLETMQRVRELVQFGEFLDSEYLTRTLAKEFQLMEVSFKEAFLIALSEESTLHYVPEIEACCTIFRNFSTLLFKICGSSLVVNPGDLALDLDIYIVVKGLQTLAMYPGGYQGTIFKLLT